MTSPVRRALSGPGQESVWDYPRPPRVEVTSRHIQVVFNRVALVDSRRAVRVLETSQAPVYYIPQDDIQMKYLSASGHATLCEWKGLAKYFDVIVAGRRAETAAWTYPDPTRGYEMLRDHVAFYPQAMEQCLVDSEVAAAMPGGFYGGWVTADVVGPFKGGPGTQGW